jgi:hypothetical protein
MVGKPNFPRDLEERDDLRRSARATPGLNALDEEREASLADEGGRSGAVMESQDDLSSIRQDEPLARVPTRSRMVWFLAAGFVVGFALLLRFRSR